MPPGPRLDLAGVGLHGGLPVRLTLRPGTPGDGLVFHTAEGRLPLREARFDEATRLASDLVSGPVRVRTAEHFLSAWIAAGAPDLDAHLTGGPELPLADGSALPFVPLLAALGPRATPPLLPVGSALDLVVGMSRYHLEPVEHDEAVEYRCVIDFPDTPIGRQEVVFHPARDDFATRLAPARTFVLERDLSAVIAAGLGRGGTPDGTVIVGANGPLVGGWRFPDEPARHKLLDLLGDLALAGGWPRGRLVAERPGHLANHALHAAWQAVLRCSS